MKKLFTLFVMGLLMASAAMAESTITFDASVDKSGNTTAGAQRIEKDGVELAITNGILGTSDNQYRIYKNQTLTITSSVGAILKVEFTCTANDTDQYGPGCFTVEEGNYAYSGRIGTWTGTANPLVFTAAKSQVRATKIVVTVQGASADFVSKPVFTPGEGVFRNSVDVAMSCSTEGAVIYYTVDGSTPTASSVAYAAPLNLQATTTVKAIAIKEGNQSTVAEATYTIESAVKVNNIAAYQQVSDSTVVQFAASVTVLGQNGNNMYVKDDTGYAYIYGQAGQNYRNGQQIPAGFSGMKITYDGEPELKDLSGFQPGVAGDEVPPEEIQCEDVSADLFGHYVLIKGAKLQYNNKLIIDASGSAPINTGMGGYGSSTDTTKTYNVYAFIGSYRPKSASQTTYRVLPYRLEEVIDISTLPQVDDVNALLEMEKGNNAVIASDLVAIYQNGNNLYVKNNDTFTLVYGKLSNTFANGDIIRGAAASWTEYQGLKQLTPIDATFVVAEHGQPVEPVEMPLEEMGQEMVHTYFIIKDATLVNDSTNYYTINDGTMDMLVFNRFGTEMPTELSGKKFDMKGFLTVYKGVLELYPVEVTPAGGQTVVPGDVTGDGAVDIADVSAAINIMLGNKQPGDYPGNADVNNSGGVDIADVSALVNMMLSN